jgi:hypothetical protein
VCLDEFRFRLMARSCFQILQNSAFDGQSFFQACFVFWRAKRKLRFQSIDDESLLANGARPSFSDLSQHRHYAATNSSAIETTRPTSSLAMIRVAHGSCAARRSGACILNKMIGTSG